jgi:hypothetical protein
MLTLNFVLECCFEKPTVFSRDKIGKNLEQVLMVNEAPSQNLHQNWAGAHLHLTWALI